MQLFHVLERLHIPCSRESRCTYLVVAIFQLLATQAALGQQVNSVYPRYAVAGLETTFTVEGVGFPSKPRAASRLDVSVSLGSCARPARIVQITPQRFRFACTLNPGRQSVNLAILLKNKKTVKRVLWQDSIQILPARPMVSYLAVGGADFNGETTVVCQSDSACQITDGVRMAGKSFPLEVAGSNLPNSTTVEGGNCALNASATSRSTERQYFNCTLKQGGDWPLKVLSARPREGGISLFNSMVTVAPSAETAR